MRRIKQRLTAAVRGFVLFLEVFPLMGLYVAVTFALCFVSLYFGLFLLPPTVLALRGFANRRRRRAAEWSGVEIAVPYRPVPEAGGQGQGVEATVRRCLALVKDPATWRDYLWSIADPVVGSFLGIIPLALVLEGFYGFVLTAIWRPATDAGMNDWYGFVHVTKSNSDSAWMTSALGPVFVVLGLAVAPAMLRAHGRWSRVLLKPTAAAEKAALAGRVEQLTSTRKDAVDIQAAEIRRIERDLHDGAQARLVAMGLNLSAAAQLLDKNPEAARGMLLDARDSSAKALNEIRDLVRGIHPPVLADRGLVDAVRALAMDSALEAEVTAEVPGTLDAPIESAAYFAVSEVLANAAKHGGAQRVWIDLRHENGVLRMTVTDDGIGGADLAGGTGLRGIERRLATFDGSMALTSPVGGPTVVTMELPCVLSSPKTSSS